MKRHFIAVLAVLFAVVCWAGPKKPATPVEKPAAQELPQSDVPVESRQTSTPRRQPGALLPPAVTSSASTPMRRTTKNEQRRAAAKRATARRGRALSQRLSRATAMETMGANIERNLPNPNVRPMPASLPAPADLYFGMYANYALSPLPAGPLSTIEILDGGSGYTNPQVTVADAYITTGLVQATVTATVTNGTITGFTIVNQGDNYRAPVIVVDDPTGTGAMATATISPNPHTGIPKFVDDLPGLCQVSGPSSTLGNCIPLAAADTTTFPGSDFYHIGLREFRQQFHSDLPPVVNGSGGTLLRGYVDLSSGAYDNNPHYLGPIILAKRNRPVRVLFENQLDTSNLASSKLRIPADTTYMGAGLGPDGTPYTENRADLHLHGGNSPWISDGTPHQWITPAGDPTTLKKGMSFANVPDMVGPSSPIGLTNPTDSDGKQTYYWTNQQSGRLLWYHDHSYGITRLNVYSGEVAGYLLYDPAQEQLLRSATVPGTMVPDQNGDITPASADLAHMLPLVIQDKTFVDAQTLPAQDPTWRWGSQPGNAVTGDLWFPHVYMPNQWPDNPDLSGTNPMGRWDYGPWFWPPQNPSSFVADGRPFSCTTTDGITTQCPGYPNPSGTPEGFMDTALVNGVAYPVLHVAPEAYRFHILNGANDRSWNLQLYLAYDPSTGTTGAGTEVKMVPAVPGTWPSGWPTADAREGGWPDPTTVGPNFVQIGTEGGLLPSPVVIQNRPIGFEYGRRSITVLNVLEKALMLGPAERADAIVNFAGQAGKTFILYNDAPAPVPAFDARIDYYTGDPDQTSSGGAPTTLPGYGPNTRTIMQIVVDQPPTGAPAFNLNTLKAAQPGIFQATQHPMIVPEKAYGFPSNTYSSISATALTYTDPGAATPTVHFMTPKAIQELFTLDYGRMNATLGVELPFTNFMTQTTIPYGYVDPPTETFKDGETQIWKITHNGVDTHAIHFHLFDVQLLNRVGWDGTIKPPEPNELSWKDTVRMNPLEDVIVALKPMKQDVPWPLPDSVRPLDVQQPVGTHSPNQFTNIDPNNNPITVYNDLTNFGWEYVWHCHLLGHEENDMMRPMVLQIAPETPTTLAATVVPQSGNMQLTFTDNAASESGYVLQRDTHADFSAATEITVPLPSGAQKNQLGQGLEYGNTVTFVDDTLTGVCQQPCQLNYRILAANTKSYAFPPATSTLLSAWSNTATVAITAIATVNPSSLSFGNQIVNSDSAAQTVTITSSGAIPLAVSNVAIAGAAFSQTNTCGSTIAAGSSCTISVTFRPAVVGAATGTLTFSTTDPSNPTFSIALTGTGVAPVIGLAPASLSFGTLQAGQTSNAQTVTVSNSGNAALTITGLSLTGTGASQFRFTSQCGTLPATVAISGSCTVSVTFAPTTDGAQTAALTFTDNSAGSPHSVALSGTGIAPVAGLSTASIAFGMQALNTTAAAQTITLTNTGTATLNITSANVTGTNAAEFVRVNNCGATLAAQASCTITVTFRPTALGNRSAVLTLVSNDPANPSKTVSLTGTGTAVSLNPLSLVFADQLVNTSSASQTVRLTNAGATTLRINSVTVTGTNAADFRLSNTCVVSMAPASSCTMSIVFRPLASGARSAALTISTNDTAQPTANVPLTGNATAAAYSISPTSLTFSSPVNAATAAQTITITSNGTAPLTISSLSLGGTNLGQFSYTTSCVMGASLAVGNSCAVNIVFLPTSSTPTSKSQTLSINVAAPAVPSTVPLTGTVIVPTYTATPASLAFGTQAVNTRSTAQTVTVTNTSAVPLTFTNITITGGSSTQFSQTSTCAAAGIRPYPSTLAAGASCTVSVTFRPTSTGAKSTSLVISSSNATPAQATIALTGTGQ